MRFSINTVLYVFPFRNRDTRLFANFKKWGYDAVELLVDDPAQIDPLFVKRELDRHGLVCGSICAAMNASRDLRGSRTAQRAGVQFLCDLLDFMVPLDCSILCGPIYSYVGRTEAVPPREYERQWRTVVRNLKIVTRKAEELGKSVCVEPINRFETDFLNTVDQGLKLIADVGGSAIKLHLDTFHANIEEKHQAAAILRAGKHLRHIHACAADRGTPGNDHIDWQAIGAALKKIKYQGDIVLETVTLDVPEIARSAAVWRRMEPTRDEIARNGVKFLRKTLL